MLDPQVYEAVRQEQDAVLSKLHHDKLYVISTPIEKRKIVVTVWVLAPENTRRKVVITDGGVEHYAELRDEDKALCGSFIADVLKGTHFKCKTGYAREDRIEYYLCPDWGYWISFFAKKVR